MEYLARYHDRIARFLYPQTFWILAALTTLVVLLAVLIRLPVTLAIDLAVTRYLQILETKPLSKIARWATFLGNTVTLCVLAAAVFILSVAAREIEIGLYTLATLIALPVNMAVKNVVDRKRPGEEQVRVYPGPRSGFSYPSGHSMATASFYGFLAFITWLYLAATPWRVPLFLLLALVPIATGLSRIYLGAHWLSDVVGGWAGGLLHVVVLAVLFTP